MIGANMQMKVFSLIVLATLLAHCPAQGDDTNGTWPAKIAATNADKHYGENGIVTGRVAQVTYRPKAVFINLDQPYPDSPFTGVIFSRFTNQFGDLSSLTNKSVEFSGIITNYQNKPEIILTNASQLTIGNQTPGLPAMPAEANAATTTPAPAPGVSPQTLLWIAGILAGCMALVLFVRKIARRSAIQAASALLLDSQSETGAMMATERPPYSEDVRAGVVANLSQWLKQKVVQRLASDRAELLATQQAAALKVLAVDERLAKIEHQIEQRNQDYERRIDELLKALITAEAENREMIRAQITFLKAEMEKARLKARQNSLEHQQY
jgi:hypothetical protein